jgi:hypothetical protein
MRVVLIGISPRREPVQELDEIRGIAAPALNESVGGAGAGIDSW